MIIYDKLLSLLLEILEKAFLFWQMYSLGENKEKNRVLEKELGVVKDSKQLEDDLAKASEAEKQSLWNRLRGKGP